MSPQPVQSVLRATVAPAMEQPMAMARVELLHSFRKVSTGHGEGHGSLPLGRSLPQESSSQKIKTYLTDLAGAFWARNAS